MRPYRENRYLQVSLTRPFRALQNFFWFTYKHFLYLLSPYSARLCAPCVLTNIIFKCTCKSCRLKCVNQGAGERGFFENYQQLQISLVLVEPTVYQSKALGNLVPSWSKALRQWQCRETKASVIWFSSSVIKIATFPSFSSKQQRQITPQSQLYLEPFQWFCCFLFFVFFFMEMSTALKHISQLWDCSV